MPAADAAADHSALSSPSSPSSWSSVDAARSSVLVLVQVLDVNEHRPMFSRARYTGSLVMLAAASSADTQHDQQQQQQQQQLVVTTDSLIRVHDRDQVGLHYISLHWYLLHASYNT